MKILLVNQTFYPDQVATAQQLLDLALHLVDEGHEVSVLCGGRSYENPQRQHASHEVFKKISIHRLRCFGAGKTSFLRRMLAGMSFELALLAKLVVFPAQDVTVYFTSPPLVGVVGAIARLFRGGRLVQWLMDINPDAAIAVGYLKPTSFFARVLRAIFGFSLRVSDQVIVLDRYMREKVEAYGVERRNISIIPPWPAKGLAGAVSVASGKSFRRAHSLENKFVVLYSGNHSIVHPLDTLLEAALRMRDDPGVLFLFIGGGFRTKDVSSFAAQHRLANIRQLPHQPREFLHESLGAADLHVVVMGDAVGGLVHTSKIYGVLALGRPYLFIGPQASHVGDLLQENPYGFHAPNGDPVGVIRAIQRARSLSESERQRIHTENIGLVRGTYSTEASVSIFSREIVGRQQQPRETTVASASAVLG